MPASDDTRLGAFLRDRRGRLDPAALGFSATRRRTPGLRREEVAARANVSVTWYTWLEQGRGGAPSADVLDRLAGALMLTEVEREHLYLIGLGRAPDVRRRAEDGVTPRLQRVLDAFDLAPAIVRTAMWDVVAWNRAACAALTDYAALPPAERNVLRMMFLDPRVRAAQADWGAVARHVVAAFRADTARAGADAEAATLAADLARSSPDFAAIWNGNDVGGKGEGGKEILHPVVGRIAFEFSSFAVDGRPDLGMVVYNPATPADVAKLRELLTRRPAVATRPE